MNIHDIELIKSRIREIAEDAENVSGCSHEDVLKDGLREISKELFDLLKMIEVIS